MFIARHPSRQPAPARRIGDPEHNEIPPSVVYSLLPVNEKFVSVSGWRLIISFLGRRAEILAGLSLIFPFCTRICASAVIQVKEWTNARRGDSHSSLRTLETPAKERTDVAATGNERNNISLCQRGCTEHVTVQMRITAT